MTRALFTIERLVLPASAVDLCALAELLTDAVDSGAAVSFLAPLTAEPAQVWWHGTLTRAATGAIFLVARSGDAIEGSVQLHPGTHAGTIPRYALDTDGVTPHDAVVYYKELAAGVE